MAGTRRRHRRSADPYDIPCSLRDAGPQKCASSGNSVDSSPTATIGSANAVATI